jgi:hypothetical protein
VVKPLVPEEHDLPLVKRLLNGGDGFGVERAGDVDALDFRADEPGDGVDRDVSGT